MVWWCGVGSGIRVHGCTYPLMYSLFAGAAEGGIRVYEYMYSVHVLSHSLYVLSLCQVVTTSTAGMIYRLKIKLISKVFAVLWSLRAKVLVFMLYLMCSPVYY
jgi:hypothetical protein